MSEFLERRRSARKNFSTLPYVFTLILAEPVQGEIPLRLEARDISVHGMKYQTNQRIPLFQEILVQLFEKKSKEEPIPLRAKVVRVEEVDTGRSEKTYGIALEFQLVGEAEKKKLLTHLPAPF